MKRPEFFQSIRVRMSINLLSRKTKLNGFFPDTTKNGPQLLSSSEFPDRNWYEVRDLIKTDVIENQKRVVQFLCVPANLVC